MHKKILLTITGPSLTGKTELAKILSQGNFEELVSTTTRPPRKGEIEGINYYFVNKNQFNSYIKDNLMLQHNPVGDNLYGLSISSFEHIIKKDKNGIVVVAPEGAKQIKAFCENNDILCHQVFVNNSLPVLVERFLQRYKHDKLASDQTYGRRIIDMLTIEQDQWVKPAYTGKDHYDQIFDNFGPETQKDTVAGILNAVQSKLDNKKKNKI